MVVGQFDKSVATDKMLKETGSAGASLTMINQAIEALKTLGYIEAHPQSRSGSLPIYDMLKITGKGVVYLNSLQ